MELLVVALVVKAVPCILFVFGGLSLRKSFNIGMLMTSRLSLIIVAATIGLEAGFITEAFKDSIILLAVITCLAGPTLFKAFYRPDDENSHVKRIEESRLSGGWMRDKPPGP